MSGPDWARWYRPLAVGLTMILIIVAAVSAIHTIGAFVHAQALGIDKATHDAFVARWSATGSMYLPEQVAGPFDPQPLPHVAATQPCMYPPTAVVLFAPFSVLPTFLWWAVPLGATAWIMARWRPAPWTWPVLAAVLVLPATLSAVWVGNTTMWAVAGVAFGLEFGWAGPLLLLKPSLAPFAIAGVWRRAWWIAFAGLALGSMAFAEEWVRYLVVVGNSGVSAAYSLGNLPVLLTPIVAWAGRQRPCRAEARRRRRGSS